jgi:hypothetical protein
MNSEHGLIFFALANASYRFDLTTEELADVYKYAM